MQIRGTLDEVITNEEKVYEGDLVRYFQIIFNYATNLNHPYHNFRHIMHVTWLCYKACKYYKNELSKREMRNLMIAAIFHDFDHRGTSGDDALNILLAVQGVQKHILPEDEPYMHDIIKLIKATQYPYQVPTSELGLAEQIIRDADLSQALSTVWLQQVIFGLASEWKKPPIEVLKAQNDFHKGMKFYTDWAQEMWPQDKINEKMVEVSKLLRILEQEPAMKKITEV